jgi:hypothetical protein
VNIFLRNRIGNRKRRIARRLDPAKRPGGAEPQFSASNIHYEMAARTRAINCGGIGVAHLLARQLGLIEAIDAEVHLLKVHLPYHESDHVLNLAYNILAGGSCIEDLELLRNDEVYLDALGASRIPDPTTAGDFCRRFTCDDQVAGLMEAINRVRTKVWQRQPESFRDLAILDADGTIAPTYGECKQGMDIAYDGQWSYHPLVISLADTKEPLYLVNRPGNRPSHEQAAAYFDKAIDLVLGAGFKNVLLRGDTDFSQTAHLDRWDAKGNVTFLFGMDKNQALLLYAQTLEKSAWHRLTRPPAYEVATEKRQRPANVKERIVEERNFENLITKWEDVAEFDYQPRACKKAHRIVALRKKIAVKMGQDVLWEEYRYFFFITNDRELSACELVLLANQRCNQENLIEQLKNGVQAMRNPLDNLHSNWAYMVMCSLAWTLKAWMGLCLPASPSGGSGTVRHQQQKEQIVKMEFKKFRATLMQLPCQIIKTGRRIIYRLLSWNPWVGVLARMAETFAGPRRC